MEKLVQKEGYMKLVLCECGRLHVTYGSVAIHFDREEFVGSCQLGEPLRRDRQTASRGPHAGFKARRHDGGLSLSRRKEMD